MYVGVCLCVGLFLLYNTDVVYSVNSVIDIRIDSYMPRARYNILQHVQLAVMQIYSVHVHSCLTVFH